MLFAVMALQAVASSAAPAPATVQQRFDAATKAVDEGRCVEAVPAFDALEREPGVRRSEMARLTLGLRRARCLIGTERDAEAEKAIVAALPVLERRGEEFADEIANARSLLVFVAQQRGDYEGAAARNLAALPGATGAARIALLTGLAELTMFDHDGRALRYAEEARGLAVAPTYSKDMVAAVQTVYARVLLNEGRNAEAYTVLKDSLAKQGGLTLKVTYGDLITRSDLAIAALLNNDRGAAQKYLAYTGAGRTKQAFGPAARMDLPPCGRDGLKPDDFAIIGLSLAADGQVTSVRPVYVRGNRATALAFAQAVRGWSWSAERAAAMTPLLRSAIRLEVRCSGGVAERLSVNQMLLDAVPDWVADARGTGTPWEGATDAVALPRQRAALAAAGGDPKARLRALIALLQNPVLPSDEHKGLLEQARRAIGEARPPAPLRLLVMDAEEEPDLRALLADPGYSADPLSAAVVRVRAAQSRMGRKSPAEAAAWLDAAIAQPGLPERHPIKVRALLVKANLLGAKGDTAAARAALAQTGLDAEQCAIAGPVPVIKRSGASDAAFPAAAFNMGFEGWVRTEFDIAANGRTVAPRAVVAYPPFVFNEAATGISNNARFASSFQPDTPVACAANTQTINFRLPD